MYKVVVVDDEVRQCRGLRNILLSQYGDLEVEAFTRADNALEYIEREKVQIVITDICMPEMDGLQLTQKIRQVSGRARVILLTGHADFEYARKAISLGAFDYLLKPVHPDKLSEVLDRAKRELEEEDLLEEQHARMAKQLDMTLPVYMEKLLNQWVYGWASREEKEEVEKVIPAGAGGFLIASRLQGLASWKGALDQDEFSEMKNRLTWWMRQNVMERGGKGCHALSFFDQIQPELMITVIVCRPEEAKYPEWLKGTGWKEQLPRHPEGKGCVPLKVVLGVGEFEPELSAHIERGYKSAVTVLDYGFYFSESEILYASYLLPRRVDHVSISLAEEEMVKTAVAGGDEIEAFSILEAILERCQQTGYPEPAQLKLACERLLTHVALSLKLQCRFMPKDLSAGYEGFMKEVRNFVEEMTGEVMLRKSGKHSEFAELFEAYLQEHFMENLSLDDLAEYFQLTPAYCSALIKEQTGNSFSRGLLQMRIDHAKRLLEQDERKIYEIALETGYQDVKYFNRVFKKETGVTPVEYRQIARGIKGD